MQFWRFFNLQLSVAKKSKQISNKNWTLLSRNVMYLLDKMFHWRRRKRIDTVHFKFRNVRVHFSSGHSNFECNSSFFGLLTSINRKQEVWEIYFAIHFYPLFAIQAFIYHSAIAFLGSFQLSSLLPTQFNNTFGRSFGRRDAARRSMMITSSVDPNIDDEYPLMNAHVSTLSISTFGEFHITSCDWLSF